MNSSLIGRMVLVATATMLLPAPAAHAAEPGGVTVAVAPDGSGIDGRYIVRLRPGTDADGFTRATGVTASRSYSSVLQGFAAAIDPAKLDSLRRDPEVIAIEQDRRWSTESPDSPVLQTPTPNWGLDRVDQRPLPLDNTFLAPSDGVGVHAYILDTGTDPSHPDFGGRADVAYDAFPAEPANCRGHGTWTGGIVGSAHFGVAKKVLIHSVRIFDCDEVTTTEKVLEGMEFIRTQGHKPAVVNMSFGGPASDMLDAGAKALWDSGFFVGSSAGNGGGEACDHSPSRAVYAVTSVNYLDRNANQSHGKCVDIYAPGVDITSLGLNKGFITNSGTSAAAPFVTGAAALYKSMFGDAPSDTIEQWLNATATPDVIQQNVFPTPNRLLFIGTGQPPAPADGTYGYVFANRPQEPGYFPDPVFQRNTTGLLNQVIRSAAGTYRVLLPGLAGTGGISHAASMSNSTVPECQVAGEGSSGDAQFIDVRCFDDDGQPADGTFVASYTRPAAGLIGAFGYVRATIKSPGPAGPVFGAGISYNSAGQTNTVTRTSAGQYLVDLPALGVPGGTVLVDAFGPDPRHCLAPDWFQVGTTQRVVVSCRDAGGALADSLFSVTFTNTRSILGTAAVRAHAWVPSLGPGSPPHSPNPIWAFNSSGGPISVKRLNTGSYEVLFSGVASSTGGQAVVRAAGFTATRCQVSTSAIKGADVAIRVLCRAVAGAPADSAFIAQFVW